MHALPRSIGAAALAWLGAAARLLLVAGRSSLIAFVAVTLAFTQSAAAQVCNGVAPFSNGAVRLGIKFGGISGADHYADAGGPSVGVRFAVGASKGPFAGVSSSVVFYTGAGSYAREGLAAQTSDDAGALVTSVTGGYAISIRSARIVEVCPNAGFSYQSGPPMYVRCSPRVGGGLTCADPVDGQARAVWFGGSIGGLVRSSPTFAFVPFASAAYVNSKLIAKGSDSSESVSDDFFGISAGAGLVLKRMTIRPTISFPVGREGSGSTFGLEFAFNIGPTRR